jgi:glycosyltransferase involved in cell wall biosynthesis
MKAILFANTDWYLFNFRLPLAKALRDAGHEVVLISPDGEYGPQIAAEGFRWETFPLSRKGMNPLHEVATIFRLRRLYRAEKPDMVHHFTIKCVLYGSMAAHLAGVPKIINGITGLGFMFSKRGLARLLRPFVLPLYRQAMRNTAAIFQNPDDIDLFHQLRLLRKTEVHMVRGSGARMDVFLPSPEPPGPPVVLMAGRFLWEKGVGEFVEAARMLGSSSRAPSLHLSSRGSKGMAETSTARFVLVGDTYPDNPGAVPPEQLQSWVDDGLVEWWGWHDDMRDIFPKAHIVCLPSYREGMPLSLAEAGACGRPLVATDVPGCREIVQDGVNGFLVPVRDAAALVDVLGKLIADAALRQEMGRRGRERVEAEFSVRRIVDETLQVYNGD